MVRDAVSEHAGRAGRQAVLEAVKTPRPIAVAELRGIGINTQAIAHAKAETTGEPCYVVRNPTTNQVSLILFTDYTPTNRRRIIEFIAFPNPRSI